MSVYIVVQLKIHNREVYARYTSRFMAVFEKYQGTLLSNDEDPRVLEGDWDGNKLVLMSFPTKEAFRDWATSPEYLEIAKDRLAGANAVILMSKSFP